MHFLGWSSRWDEWIEASERIQRAHTKVRMCGCIDLHGSVVKDGVWVQHVWLVVAMWEWMDGCIRCLFREQKAPEPPPSPLL